MTLRGVFVRLGRRILGDRSGLLALDVFLQEFPTRFRRFLLGFVQRSRSSQRSEALACDGLVLLLFEGSEWSSGSSR